MADKDIGLGKFLQDIVAGVEKTLTSKILTPEPITAGAYTIVPLVSIGVGFGGGGYGGLGGGGGGGITPVAVVIVGPEGAQVVTIGAATCTQKISDAAGRVIADLTAPKK